MDSEPLLQQQLDHHPTFSVDSWWGRTATTSIFMAAAITDWLDGYIARRMRLCSAFGALLDPVADKLMVAATLVLLCSRPLNIAVFGQVPWLLNVPSIAIIGREITMSAVREWAASQNGKLLAAVAVNKLGKWKTATQMAALTILLATRDSSLGETGILVASGVIFLYLSAGLSVMSLVVSSILLNKAAMDTSPLITQSQAKALEIKQPFQSKKRGAVFLNNDKSMNQTILVPAIGNNRLDSSILY
ncbi:hypothetical protein GOBAR_DD04230 [Gossypium barbadense]|nr:hypothetical protein GOBAR_DD04230 [Gossypium barbadense]